MNFPVPIAVILIVFNFRKVYNVSFSNNACDSLNDYPLAYASSRCFYNPDVLSDIPSTTRRHGYNLRGYSLTTSDGYILTIFRVSSPVASASKCPVLLLHGITTSAFTWVDTANNSLGHRSLQEKKLCLLCSYEPDWNTSDIFGDSTLKVVVAGPNLSDLRYDVWLGTVRGIEMADSQKHLNFTINDPKYWDYNLDTLANIDLKLQLQFVNNATGKRVLVCGHSMGATLTFMYAADNPSQANTLISAIIVAAPVVYLENVASVENVKRLGFLFLDFLNLINIKGLFYQENSVHILTNTICRLAPQLCVTLIDFFFGRTVQFEAKDLLLFYSSWLTGTSIFQFKQYLQFCDSGRFQHYDYGAEGNRNKYGVAVPPIYNLSHVRLPVHIFYGTKDSLYREDNLNRLYQEIGSSSKHLHRVPVNNQTYDFSHIDFGFSQYVREFFYCDLFSVIDGECSGTSRLK